MILSLFICLLYTNMIILPEIKLVLLAEFKWLMDGIAESNCSIWFFRKWIGNVEIGIG